MQAAQADDDQGMKAVNGQRMAGDQRKSWQDAVSQRIFENDKQRDGGDKDQRAAVDVKRVGEILVNLHLPVSARGNRQRAEYEHAAGRQRDRRFFGNHLAEGAPHQGIEHVIESIAADVQI